MLDSRMFKFFVFLSMFPVGLALLVSYPNEWEGGGAFWAIGGLLVAVGIGLSWVFSSRR